MASTVTIPKQLGFGQTTRSDAWWMQPIAVFLGFSAFIIYSTWAALQGTNPAVCYYWYGWGGGANYLSPFYSPSLFGSEPHPGIFGRHAGVVARLGALLARFFDHVDSGGIPFHLLLLSRRLL